MPSGNPNAFRKITRDLSATAPMSWLLSHTLHRVDKPVFDFTKGKHTLSSLITGLPVIMLTTTGAKSGKVRTVPVLGLPDGDRIVVFASGYGRGSRAPAWYYNLRAEPQVSAIVDGVERRFRSYEAEGEERGRLWREGVRIYPGFADYEQRTTNRGIPVIVLSPSS
ncbi:MAG: nitroreductase/quinone reductase family protein [Rubrobacteraceae bacterium]